MDPVMIDMSKLSEIRDPEGKKLKLSVSLESVRGEPGRGGVSFEELLSSSVKEVNALQLEADGMLRKLATGDVEDISEVVMASSRAEVALRMFMELRNKFVDAYQQLSRMSA